SDALPPLDDNHAIYAIDAVLQKSQALALDDNHAIDALLQKSETPTFDNNHCFDALLHESDTYTLDDDTSQSSKYMLQDSINDSPSHRHLRRNTPLRNIEAVDPRNFNYDSPYTTMLSTPYFETWSLLFLTIVPRNHQNLPNSTRRLRMKITASSLPTRLWCQRSPTTRHLAASLAVPYDTESLSARLKDLHILRANLSALR
ncbi:hypothetical protein P692DRAFT_20871535, partial [Suillus brevipes Sb2]